jgi:hypothetical protein
MWVTSVIHYFGGEDSGSCMVCQWEFIAIFHDCINEMGCDSAVEKGEDPIGKINA